MIEERLIPSAFAPFYAVHVISPTAIPLGSWPDSIYAGRHLAWAMGRTFLHQLPLVPEVIAVRELFTYEEGETK